jgi:adenylosuccinate lyase
MATQFSLKPLRNMNDANMVYDNPLVGRYAGREMSERWGPMRKFRTWRRLWLALAEAQYELGMTADDGVTPRIRPEQIAELRAHLDDVDLARADAHERRLRHDVMAHIHALAEVAPVSRDIIHLGATSCYVTDNTDLILMREGLNQLCNTVAAVIDTLARFAEKWKDEPTLGFTHFQPAQLTTVGKRACLWSQDFVFDLIELERRRDSLRFRGAKGTTGTQASFLALFHGDHAKVRKLDQLVARKMGFDAVYPVTGQTYSRKVDAQILDALAGLGQSAHKWGTDLRLLAHRQDIDEPFEAEQVGSSAMAYKRNPMRSERMCSLSRFLGGMPALAAQTAAGQWLERTLDDSAARRLYIPQAFLAADGVVRLARNLAGGMAVNRPIVQSHVAQAMPLMVTENIMMEAVAKGGDRQIIHECIRQHSIAVNERIKQGVGLKTELFDRLRADPMFAGVDVDRLVAPAAFIGRSSQQVEEFIAQEIDPIRGRYAKNSSQTPDITV